MISLQILNGGGEEFSNLTKLELQGFGFELCTLNHIFSYILQRAPYDWCLFRLSFYRNLSSFSYP